MSNWILRTELDRDEGGLQTAAYADTAGYWTIGRGHRLNKVSEGPARMTLITRPEGEALFNLDLQRAIDDANAVFPHLYEFDRTLRGPRYRAVVNMAFNLGRTGLLTFKKFIAAMNAHDWHRAGAEMLDSKWARQVGARAIRLRDLVVNG